MEIFIIIWFLFAASLVFIFIFGIALPKLILWILGILSLVCLLVLAYVKFILKHVG